MLKRRFELSTFLLCMLMIYSTTFKRLLGSPVEADKILFNAHQTKRAWYKCKLINISVYMDPASSFTYFISCQSLSLIFKRVPFPRGFECLPILHILLTESSIMTPIGAECATWTEKIITPSRQCFKPQPGISWATSKWLQQKHIMCACVSVWGRLGRSGTSRISQTFRDVFWLLFYPFQHSTTKHCTWKSAVLFCTASDSLLKTHGCCS